MKPLAYITNLKILLQEELTIYFQAREQTFGVIKLILYKVKLIVRGNIIKKGTLTSAFTGNS